MIAAPNWTAARKISSEFVIARGNGAAVLDFVEEALDEIAH
jgi:hypothetical protein